MKNILGIVGSPRRNGNTHVLVARILEGAASMGAKTETVFLGDLRIHECEGCHACWGTGECCKRDDMNALFPKIGECNGMVLGTPVYWYGPSALMKGFVDRLVYFNSPEHRPRIRGKAAVIAVPFEEQDPETASLVVQFFEKCFHYLQMDFAGKVIVPGVTRRGEVRENADCMNAAYELGRALGR